MKQAVGRGAVAVWLSATALSSAVMAGDTIDARLSAHIEFLTIDAARQGLHSTRYWRFWQDRLNDSLENALTFDSAGWKETDPGYPVVRIRRSVIDRVLKSTGDPESSDGDFL